MRLPRTGKLRALGAAGLIVLTLAFGQGCAHLRAPWSDHDPCRPEETPGVSAGRPSVWPVDAPDRQVVSEYGVRRGRSRRHKGIDIKCAEGTPVRATADGVVTEVRTQGAYGKIIVVDHGDGYSTAYAHLCKQHASPGQEVRRGEILGGAGRSGNASCTHLHYEVRRNGTATNPRPYLP
ncbi:MAG: M23 family metallopeptidase [Candidatus Hydrogenedentes bacterium]|nr:M23 family metallopeptidase [Candidatus Hydrogenedentota bacterium]